MTDALALYRDLARYNEGANRRLYSACADLTDAARRADRGAFFGSIHATLNHILLGDRIWMTRFEGGSAPSTGLDAELYAAFAALRAAREAEDRRIARFVGELETGDLARQVDYVNNEGRRFSDPLPVLLIHLFNHQTHHRGQVHAMLTQAGAAGPVLDLHRVLIPDP